MRKETQEFWEVFSAILGCALSRKWSPEQIIKELKCILGISVKQGPIDSEMNKMFLNFSDIRGNWDRVRDFLHANAFADPAHVVNQLWWTANRASDGGSFKITAHVVGHADKCLDDSCVLLPLF